MSNAISSTNLTHLYREAGRAGELLAVFEQTDSFKPWIAVLAVIGLSRGFKPEPQ